MKRTPGWASFFVSRDLPTTCIPPRPSHTIRVTARFLLLARTYALGLLQNSMHRLEFGTRSRSAGCRGASQTVAPPSLLACSSLRKPRLRQRKFVCACPRRLHIRHPAAGSNIIRSQSQHLCLTKRLLAISLIAHAVSSGVALRGIHATCSPQNGIHAILPPSDFAFREVKSGFVGSIVRA